MFTGIIQDLGKIKSKVIKGDSIRFYVKPDKKKFLKDVNEGDSISINGACMTVEKISSDKFKFTTINESLSKTNLSLLKIGNLVNLEKAMTLTSKLDGHIVQGHVDTTGILKNIEKLEDSWEYFIEFSNKFGENVIYVGSIAINGISLTVAEIINENSGNMTVKVAIIPHTFEATNFKKAKEGDIVNIEFDMLGKYVNRIFKENKKTAG